MNDFNIYNGFIDIQYMGCNGKDRVANLRCDNTRRNRLYSYTNQLILYVNILPLFIGVFNTLYT